MTTKRFKACLAEILHHEGGFVNHPKDPGGMTNLGVTKATYENWIGHRVNEAIMRKLTPQLVAPLYKAKFWDVLRCSSLPVGLDLCVFDFGVNAGVSRSAKLLQMIVGVEADGVVGPATIKAVKAKADELGVDGLIQHFQDARRAFYRKLKTFPTFGKGWLRRVDDIGKKALATVNGVAA